MVLNRLLTEIPVFYLSTGTNHYPKSVMSTSLFIMA